MDTYFEYGREINSASAQNLLVSPGLFVIGSPPANIPAPMISFEKATWSWTEKYPPDEKPDMEIKFLLTRYDSMPEHEEEREDI